MVTNMHCNITFFSLEVTILVIRVTGDSLGT